MSFSSGIGSSALHGQVFFFRLQGSVPNRAGTRPCSARLDTSDLSYCKTSFWVPSRCHGSGTRTWRAPPAFWIYSAKQAGRPRFPSSLDVQEFKGRLWRPSGHLGVQAQVIILDPLLAAAGENPLWSSSVPERYGCCTPFLPAHSACRDRL
jgi:hypothetical protein